MRTLIPAAALVLSALLCTPELNASPPSSERPLAQDKFRQLDEMLPTPNDQRTASGAPGRRYWQQRADYRIEARLDEQTHTLAGHETITYHNNSPDELAYLWLQLDHNLFAADADARLVAHAPDFAAFTYDQLEALLYEEDYSGELKITAVTDAERRPLPYTIVRTMMRIDLREPLASGARTSFSISWSMRLNSDKGHPGRTGYTVAADGNALYTIAQWYPRMAAYTDLAGWQTRQFVGYGEFALEFGDFLVRLDVPGDHVVAATGALQNPEQVLTAAQRARLQRAQKASEPLFIVTPEEARAASAARSSGRKTWVFRAENVRDFAFGASRRFMWDAMGVPGQGPAPVLAMSFYAADAEALWSRYSTQAIAHALDVFSRYTFPYPYPVAISVSSPTSDGMEYPMISFNSPRSPDGTYTRDEKYGFISMILHEAGHNYFPMIVNTDERQWTWMDEALTGFLQYVAQQHWEKAYPDQSYSVYPSGVLKDMKARHHLPVMTASESIPPARFEGVSYSKPATALNILRETVLGRELFDHALRTYAQRWKFKRPYPADFFRTMEDASGVDLDWFWRGWFYGTDPVDLAIGSVRLYRLDTRDPEVENRRAVTEESQRKPSITDRRNEGIPRRVDAHPELRDFYSSFDRSTVLPSDRQAFEELIKNLRDEEIDPALLRTQRFFYAVELRNVGGLPMPALLRMRYADGREEELRIPAEIWRFSEDSATKLLMTRSELTHLELDPHEETLDVERANNFWGGHVERESLRLEDPPQKVNPMRELRNAP